MKFLSMVFLVIGAATFGVAAPFMNGGFELPGPTYTPPAEYLSYGDLFVTGWVHDGTDLGEFYTDGAAWGISAGEGSYYVGFGAFSQTGGTLSQTFDTNVGTTYFVNYLLTTQELDANLPDQAALVEALDGSTVLGSAFNTINQAAGTWTSGISFAFTATSTSSTLRFTDMTPLANSAPINWGLDAVSVGVVPEPSSIAMIGLGLGLLALRRVKQSR